MFYGINRLNKFIKAQKDPLPIPYLSFPIPISSIELIALTARLHMWGKQVFTKKSN